MADNGILYSETVVTVISNGQVTSNIDKPERHRNSLHDLVGTLELKRLGVPVGTKLKITIEEVE